MLRRRTRCGCCQVEVRFAVANLNALKVEIVNGSWGTTNQMLLLVLQLLLLMRCCCCCCMPHVSFRTFSSFSLFNFALADHLAESLSSHWSLQQKLSLLPFCIQNACNKQNAFTCAQLSTLMQRNKPPGCRDSSTTGCQYGRMPCPCLHSPSSTPNPLRAIYSIISFSYSYFPAAAAAPAIAVATVRCTALAFYL